MNANLVFKWLNDPRFALAAVVADEQAFLSVKISQMHRLISAAVVTNRHAGCHLRNLLNRASNDCIRRLAL